MSDVADILGLQSAKSNSVFDETIKYLNEKPKGLNAGPKLIKKPKGMSREVFSLIGADSLVPAIQGNKPNAVFKSKRSSAVRGKWILTNFTNSSRNDDIALQHWVKADIQYNDYPYTKFNVKQQAISYSDDEYELLLSCKNWTKEETAHLLELVNIYGPRWPIITDRFEMTPNKSTEDLQDRYYNIVTRLRQHRTGIQNNESSMNNDNTTSFNYEHEKRRRFQLEISYRKSKEEELEESQLREELKNIDALIKKAKKNIKANLAITTDLSKVPEVIPLSLPEMKNLSAAEIHLSTTVPTVIDYPSPGKPFLQSSRLIVNETSLNLSKNLIKKINTLLRDLGLLEFPLPTKAVCDYYDQIRQQAITLLSIQSNIKQKEKDLLILRAKQNVAMGNFNPFNKELIIPHSHQIVNIPANQVLNHPNIALGNYPNVVQHHILPTDSDLVSSLGVGMILAESHDPGNRGEQVISPNHPTNSKKATKRKLSTDTTNTAIEGGDINAESSKKAYKRPKKPTTNKTAAPTITNIETIDRSNDQNIISSSDFLNSVDFDTIDIGIDGSFDSI